MALAAEVLRAYLPMWWRVRRHTLEATVHSARTVRPRTVAVQTGAETFVAERLGRAASRTLALLPTDSRCLVRSLVVLRLLARHSLNATLLIGVRPGSDVLAHAWVEYDGRPVVPAGDFDPLAEL
jgi:hypothetical protein